MDEQERLKLKKRYEEMPSEKIMAILLEDEKEYKKEPYEAYELLLEEAKKRGLLKIEPGKPISMGEIELKKEVIYASTDKRFLNFFLDYFICFGLVVILTIILSLFGIFTEGFWEENNPAWTFLWIISYFLYYFIFESKYQRTPAKFITKTKVLDIKGSKPNKSQIVKRSLIRFIPFEPLSGFGGRTPWYGWHDRWSYTMVVDSNYPEFVSESSVAKQTKTITRRTRRCPYCDEEIPYEAIKCQYCKEFLNKSIQK